MNNIHTEKSCGVVAWWITRKVAHTATLNPFVLLFLARSFKAQQPSWKTNTYIKSTFHISRLKLFHWNNYLPYQQFTNFLTADPGRNISLNIRSPRHRPTRDLQITPKILKRWLESVFWVIMVRLLCDSVRTEWLKLWPLQRAEVGTRHLTMLTGHYRQAWTILPR